MSDFSGNFGGDFDSDERMDAVFADVRGTVAPYLRPPGTAAAHATVRHRRRVRVVAGAILAASLVLGPAVGVAVASGRHAPTNGNGSTPTPSATTQTPDPTPSTSPSASGDPSPGTGSPPDGEISLADLKNATLDIPAWPADGKIGDGCQQGKVTFHDGSVVTNTNYGRTVTELAGPPVYTDVDHDGARETVIRVRCAVQGEVSQVVVFDRDEAGGIRTIGPVTAVTGAVRKIFGIDDGGDGLVKVEVGDHAVCCGTPPELPQHQWRIYRFDGAHFTQSGGPTSFPANPRVTDLSVSVQGPAFVKQANNEWHGQLKVTVRNNGKFATNLALQGHLDEVVFGPGTGFQGCDLGQSTRDFSFRCTDPIGPGASREFVIEVVTAAYAQPVPGRTGSVDVSSTLPRGQPLPDTDSSNNRATITE